MKCIVVDDEPIALEGIASYVQKTPFLELTSKCKNAYEALKITSEQKIDLVFLDINMPDLTGIEMVNAMENPPMIIFTTAYPDYALKGFELNVVDYILKPISYDKFLKASQKACNLFNLTNKEVNTSETDFIYIKVDKKLVKVQLNEILFIESLKDYIQIHTKITKYVTYLGLNKMMDVLPESDFIQVHKSYIIAMNAIETIESNAITIKQNVIPLGRSFKANFDDTIDKNYIKK